MFPSFFIAHGSPLIAIEDNEYTKFLSNLGNTLPRPRAIVLFSAHWESDIQKVSSVEEYNTIYDFGGFPDELYKIQYPAKGNNEIATEIEELFKEQGLSYEVDYERGLDHGAWTVLKLLYPKADVPIISLSVNPSLSPDEHFSIGKSLEKLREKDVLIIGSGGTVHNLSALNWDKVNGEVDEWAADFDKWLESVLKNWDLESLFNYRTLAPNANLAVPKYGVEHFIPLLYAMGAADNDEKAELIHRSYDYGNLSYSIWKFGK